MMKIFISLLLYSSLFAADTYNFVVENATMVDIYWNIFNAISSIFNNNGYLQLLKLIFLMGGFYTFLVSIVGKDVGKSPQKFAKYMVIGMVITTMAFSNKSDILIKTNNFPSYCLAGDFSSTPGSLVGNVPTLFAWGASFTNELGEKLTTLSRQAFSPVTATSVSMSRDDFASSLSMIGKVMNTTMDDISAQSAGTSGTIGDRYTSVMNDCILIPASQDPNKDAIISTIKNSGYLQGTVDDFITNGDLNTYKNPTLGVSTNIMAGVTFNNIPPKLMLTTVQGEIKECGIVWNSVKADLDALTASKNIACMSNFKDQMTPTVMSVFTGTTGITEPQMNSIVINVALANQISNSKTLLATGTNIKEMSYATSKSMAEVVLKSKASGSYMAEMLPYLQMGVRAILYAFFPFIFIVILLPGGLSVAVQYMKSVIWVELWTPTAAILDMFLNLEAQNKMTTMYNSTGMNAGALYKVFSDASMLSGVGGYLYASVPAITWMILGSTGEGLNKLGSGLMGGASGGFDNIVQKNLSTTTQNADRAEQEIARRTGHSIAEVESGATINQAKIEAGKWVTETANKDHLMEASSGKTSQNIIQGIAAGKTNLGANGKIDTAVMNLEITKDLFMASTDISSAKEQGWMNKDGSIDEKNIEKVQSDGSLKGDSDATRNQTKIKTYDALSNHDTQVGLQHTVDVNSAKNIGDFSKQVEIQSKLESAGLSTEVQGRVEGANLARKDVSNVTKVSLIGEDVNSLAAAGKADGTIAASKTLINKEVLDYVSPETLRDAQTQAIYKELGVNRSIYHNLMIQRKEAISQGFVPKHGTSIVGMAADMSSIGLTGKTGKAVGGDAHVNQLNSYGSKTSIIEENSATSQVASIQADKDYLYNLIEGSKRQVVGKDGKLLVDSKGNPIIMIDKTSREYKVFHDAQKMLGVGGITNVNASGLAALARSLMSNESNVYKTSAEHSSTNIKRASIGSTEKGSIQGNAALAKLHKEDFIQTVLDADTRGAMEAGQYGLRMMEDIIQFGAELVSLLDFDRNQRVTELKEKVSKAQLDALKLKEESRKLLKEEFSLKADKRELSFSKEKIEKLLKNKNLSGADRIRLSGELTKIEESISKLELSIQQSKNVIGVIKDSFESTEKEVFTLNKDIKKMTNTTTQKLKEMFRAAGASEKELATFLAERNNRLSTEKITDAMNLADKKVKDTLALQEKIEKTNSLIEKTEANIENNKERLAKTEEKLRKAKTPQLRAELEAKIEKQKSWIEADLKKIESSNASITSALSKIDKNTTVIAKAGVDVKVNKIKMSPGYAIIGGAGKIAKPVIGVALLAAGTVSAIELGKFLWDDNKSTSENILRESVLGLSVAMGFKKGIGGAGAVGIYAGGNAILDVMYDNKNRSIWEGSVDITTNALSIGTNVLVGMTGLVVAGAAGGLTTLATMDTDKGKSAFKAVNTAATIATGSLEVGLKTVGDVIKDGKIDNENKESSERVSKDFAELNKIVEKDFTGPKEGYGAKTLSSVVNLAGAVATTATEIVIGKDAAQHVMAMTVSTTEVIRTQGEMKMARENSGAQSKEFIAKEREFKAAKEGLSNATTDTITSVKNIEMSDITHVVTLGGTKDVAQDIVNGTKALFTDIKESFIPKQAEDTLKDMKDASDKFNK